MNFLTALQLTSGSFALLAAYLWSKASADYIFQYERPLSVVLPPINNEHMLFQAMEDQIHQRHYLADVIDKLNKQSFRNAMAAACAGLSALFQFFSLVWSYT